MINNSKNEQKITDIVDYFEQNNIVNLSVKTGENNFTISSQLINYNIAIDTIIIIFCIFLYRSNSTYYFMMLLGIPIGGFMLWKDYDSINTVFINNCKKKIYIIPKNICKKKKEINFDDINYFDTDYEETKASFKRYFVKLVLNSKIEINIFDLNKKIDAEYIAQFLNSNVLNG